MSVRLCEGTTVPYTLSECQYKRNRHAQALGVTIVYRLSFIVVSCKMRIENENKNENLNVNENE